MYGYVGGNPINRKDNYGLFWENIKIGGLRCNLGGLLRCLMIRGWLSRFGPYVTKSCQLCMLIPAFKNPACWACIGGLGAGMCIAGACFVENCE